MIYLSSLPTGNSTGRSGDAPTITLHSRTLAACDVQQAVEKPSGSRVAKKNAQIGGARRRWELA